MKVNLKMIKGMALERLIDKMVLYYMKANGRIIYSTEKE
jgi:hypothetical protein